MKAILILTISILLASCSGSQVNVLNINSKIREDAKVDQETEVDLNNQKQEVKK